MAEADYEFTIDWFSMRCPHWPTFEDHSGPLHFLEIGSHEGRSAIWQIEHLLTHPDSTITCVDHWKNRETEARFDRNILRTGQSVKVRKIKSDSWRALCRLPFGYNLAYIDGSHEARAVLEDAVWAFRLLKPGGFLIFDDYEWQGKSAVVPPKPAVDGFLLCYAPRIEILHKEWQVILRKRV